MKIYENNTYDAERALYGESDICVRGCTFAGEADGESALKECRSVSVEGCSFVLRYPLWHDCGLRMNECRMSETCRAPLWYTEDAEITHSVIHAPKALRECRAVRVSDSEIVSEELGWMCDDVSLTRSSVSGAYLFFRTKGLVLDGVSLTGKYSLQYVEGGEIKNSNLDTKDSLWHAKDVTVRDSTLRGEYLGWYCENVTLVNCKIIGTQPFCYCKNLKLIDCTMEDCDLAFERSSVDATVLSHVVSIKNPLSGRISVMSVGEIIRDIDGLKCEITVGKEAHS